MSKQSVEPSPQPSRRNLAFGLLAVAGGLAGAPSPVGANATPKLSQGDSGYQSSPRGGQRCDQCINWRAPGACRVVAGAISASGWCSLFARKL